MIDSDAYSHPEFGPAPNLTKVQVDSTAFLHCNVLHLQDDNQVSFLRQIRLRLSTVYENLDWYKFVPVWYKIVPVW